MKILMNVPSRFPPDIRVRRQANFLQRNSHTVHVVCYDQGNQPTREEVDGHQVTRVPALTESHEKPLHVLNRVGFYYTLVDYRRYRQLKSVAESFEPDLIHSHDIQSIRESALVADSRDCPLVIDLHELYPESFVAQRRSFSFAEKLKWFSLLKTKWRYERFEGKALRRADAVICESSVAKEHYVDSWDIEEEDLFVVRNTPDLSRFASVGSDPRDFGSEFVVAYAGHFSAQRDFETIIEAIDIARGDIYDIRLLLIGDGRNEYVAELKSLVERKNLESNVTFTGWVDFEDVLEYFAASDVSLCLTVDDNADSQAAIANKLFQSLAVGTPVVVSRGRAMRQIVESTESGTSIQSEDPAALAQTLIELEADPDSLERMGANGRTAVEETYNFETEYQTLLNAYERAR